MDKQSQILQILEKLHKSYENQHFYIREFFQTIFNVDKNSQSELLKDLLFCVKNLGILFIVLLNNEFYTFQINSLIELGNKAEILEILEEIANIFSFEDPKLSSISPLLEILLLHNNKFKQKKKEGLLSTVENIYIIVNKQLNELYQTKLNLELMDENFYSLLNSNDNDLDNHLKNLSALREKEEENLIKLLIKSRQIINTELKSSKDNYNSKEYIYDYYKIREGELIKFEGDILVTYSYLKEKYLNDMYSAMDSTYKVQKEKIPLKIENSEMFIQKSIFKNNPRYRTSFIINEDVKVDECEDIEFKNYRFPLESELIFNLQKQYCGMLNSQGGRIYIGINDDRVVKGVSLNPKQRDLAKMELINFTNNFSPKCRTTHIKVHFIPVKINPNDNSSKQFKNIVDGRYINNMWVIKIIIKQGETSDLYSTDEKLFKSFIRLNGMSVILKTEEIKDEIIRRKTKPKEKINDEEFIDPEPERYLELDQIVPDKSTLLKENTHTNINRENNGDNAIKNLFNSKKKLNTGVFVEKFVQPKEDEFITTVKIRKIPSTITNNEIENLFKKYKLEKKRPSRILRDPQTKEGWAFINFLDKKEGIFTLNKFNSFTSS